MLLCWITGSRINDVGRIATDHFNLLYWHNQLDFSSHCNRGQRHSAGNMAYKLLVVCVRNLHHKLKRLVSGDHSCAEASATNEAS